MLIDRQRLRLYFCGVDNILVPFEKNDKDSIDEDENEEIIELENEIQIFDSNQEEVSRVK
jgi:hypothetical protein